MHLKLQTYRVRVGLAENPRRLGWSRWSRRKQVEGRWHLACYLPNKLGMAYWFVPTETLNWRNLVRLQSQVWIWILQVATVSNHTKWPGEPAVGWTPVEHQEDGAEVCPWERANKILRDAEISRNQQNHWNILKPSEKNHRIFNIWHHGLPPPGHRFVSSSPCHLMPLIVSTWLIKLTKSYQVGR